LRLLLTVILAAGVLMMTACENSNTYVPPPPPPVTIAQPVPGDVKPYLEFTGNTQAVRTVQLRARVEGYLEKILFKEGDIVNEGQVLFIIQQNTYQAKLKEAQAQLLAAKARMMHAETEFARFTGLLRENAAAQTDVDRWHYERDGSKADVMAAEAQVELAQLNLNYTTVRAPFRGRVSRRYKDPGNVVGAGEETVLADINQIDPIYAYFTISEQDLLRVRRNHQQDGTDNVNKLPTIPITLGMANENGYPHRGQLDYRGIQVDSNTGTLQLRAILSNPDYRILPGLFVRIRADTGNPEQRLMLPEEAIGFDQSGAFVLVVDDKNLVARQAVTLGTKAGGHYAVTSGVSERDWVVINGLLRAVPGRPVTPTRISAGGAQAGAPAPPATAAARPKPAQ
jgi:RND family efflux transporter MFP subunit